MIQAAAAIDIAAIQTALKADGFDAWLLYDFHGSNPIAAEVTAPGRQTGHLATRRWYYLIPASGEPRGLVHAIERHVLAHLPGTIERYAGREELERGLRELVRDVRRVAMEYSPNGAIPYLGRVDAGTIEQLRGFGLDIASSGDLVQRFAAVWDARAIDTHMQASEKLYRVKDRAFAAIRDGLKRSAPVNEYDIQQQMMGWFREEGLVTDSPPIVAAASNGGNPHYQPTASDSRAIRPGDMIVLDLWGKLDRAGAVFADITWVGYAGAAPPERFVKVFDTVAAARDAAVTLVQNAAKNGRSLQGWEVDRAASTVLRDAGFGGHVLHRTGHSLGESVHGNGVNMDDYETHDDRRLLPGTGFTIEPGLYFDDFGVRLEINMLVREHDAIVTGPVQKEIIALG
jgi:Xaa-Pro dipeptidase